MLILKIFGIVLAVIVLLITVILLFPVDIIIKKDDEQEIKILYKYLFWIFGEESDPDNKIVKNLLHLSGVSKITDVGDIKANADTHGVSATVSDTVSVFMGLVRQVVWIFKYLKLKKLYIDCVCAGEDCAQTAMDYGVACAVIYPLSGYLHSVMKVNRRKEKINIQCDFNSEDPIFILDTVISVRLIFVVWAFLKLVKEETEKKLQEMN